MTQSNIEFSSKRAAIKTDLLRMKQTVEQAQASGLLAYPELIRTTRLLEEVEKIIAPWDTITNETIEYRLSLPAPVSS